MPDSFRRSPAQDVRSELSRLLNSQGVTLPELAGACRDDRRCRAGSGLERLVASEYVPGGDQDPARDGRLRGAAVSMPAADVT